MTRYTPYHGWPVPEIGDTDFATTIDKLIDAIDRRTLLIGRPDERPPSGTEDRLWLEVPESPLGDDAPAPQLYYDTGTQWIGVGGAYDYPDDLTSEQADEVIDGEWTFNEPIDADITGEAREASSAENAELADDARRLGGDPADEYLKSTDDLEIDGEWTFHDTQTFERGLSVGGRTLDLPAYDGADPPINDRELGSLWFREDAQPSS